jgi:hypothetical protein
MGVATTDFFKANSPTTVAVELSIYTLVRSEFRKKQREHKTWHLLVTWAINKHGSSTEMKLVHIFPPESEFLG